MAFEQIPVTRSVLTWARTRAGYSFKDLEGDFKKIASWESPEGTFPTYPQLERLADKLKVPVAVFFFPEPPDIPPIEETFRTLGPDQIDMIPPRVRLLLRKARAFQMSLAELTNGHNPAGRIITRDLAFDAKGSVSAMAKKAREYIGISLEEQMSWGDPDIALKHWRRALLDVGVYVFKDKFRQEDYSGFSLYDDEFPIIYVNNTTAKTRQAFTLFHELAHLIFHTSGIDTLTDDYINTLPKDNKQIEIACNRFAARFLVPEDAFQNAFSGSAPSAETAEELADLFNVSREFIFRKFLDQGLISQTVYKAAAKRWADQKKTGTGGDWYRNTIAYLGQEYIDLAFSQYHQNRIDESQLADYLDVKPKLLLTLEEYVSGG
ncbi:MAG: ImmA/IrrE family metallo-endopeptidase [Alphaproteobacteria bacterium]|nr:ImmA/IrrE family metallo-endopeptidase [Alphaproteobacteria bacterium]